MKLFIGESFINAHPSLHLFPGIKDIPGGWLTLEIQYTNQEYYSYTTSTCDRHTLWAQIGDDVYSIDVSLSRHHAYSSLKNFRYNYRLRIDQLIMLNLACKLLSL